MSQQGQSGQSLLQQIEADISSAEGWVGQEVLAFASAAWGSFKTLFQTITAEQVTIVKSLVAEAEADQAAGDSSEVTVADVLNLAEAKELAWVASLPDQTINSLIGLFKTKFGD